MNKELKRVKISNEVINCELINKEKLPPSSFVSFAIDVNGDSYEIWRDYFDVNVTYCCNAENILYYCSSTFFN
ncbi:hypothetical protein [Bacteroides acidifaciens]|uniref:hypothetical protein n=1 Tax=Bacteroides acidifaciens TaxID=85831 RepID=UPI0025AE3206|nr:hypothetical protein [Bacteroides acidifaciens]